MPAHGEEGWGQFAIIEGRNGANDRLLAGYVRDGMATECVQQRCDLCAEYGAALRELIPGGTVILRTAERYEEYRILGLFQALGEVDPGDWDRAVENGVVVPLSYVKCWAEWL
jgi:hypothetical protein